MSTLTIRKKSLKTWLHTDSVLGDFIISKFYFNADNVSFQIVEQGQSRRVIYNINDITLYALASGGTAETFTTITQLSLRLEQLNYPAFQLDGQITSIANLLEGGDGVEITGDGTEANPYIINLTSGDALFLGSFNSLVALQTAHPVALNGSYAFVSQTGADIVYFFSTDDNNWWTVSGGVTSVNTKTGAVVLNQDEILDGTTFKQYSLTEKNKLAGIANGAEVNVNADWNATSGDAQILNKPSIPSAQIQSDWTQANTSALDFIKNKPSITTPNLQQVLLQGDRPLKDIKSDYTIEDADRAKYLLITDKSDLTLNFDSIAENSELLIKNSTDSEVNLVVGFAVTIVFNNTEFLGGSSLPIEKGDLFILKQYTDSNIWYLTIVKGIQASIPRFSEVLNESNETDGNNIAISNGDAIILDNGANLKKGTTDAGLGGSKGIALRCAVDYELKWEAGRLYVMGGDGFTIREVSHNFTTTPTEYDDNTKGFVEGSRWILDNGDVYVCTDATTGAAVWELQGVIVPNLNSVTSVGNSTLTPIIINNAVSNEYLELGDNYIAFRNTGFKFISLQPLSPATSAKTIYVPDANGLMALTSDIPTLVEGSGIDIDYTDPLNPIISATGGGGGGVPYTGATQNVDLGEFGLKAGQLTLDTTPTGTAVVTATRWNDTLGSSETTLKGGSVILKNGVDLVARIVNKVTPNTTLTKAAYQVVKVSGAQGQRLAVDLARANSDLNSADTLGVVTETIATNQEGFILTVGQLEGINTTGSLQGETWADGDVLYLSPTTAGRMTNIKPNGSNGHIVVIGYVEHAHNTQGKIYVKIMNGWELDELHNVFIDTPLNNQGLVYETSTDLWKNKTIIEDSITNGVTSIAPSQNAVFDALALKQAVLSYTPYKNIQTSQTAHTGTTAETPIFTATIPAGAFNANDVIKVLFGANKTTGLGAYTLRLRVSATNNPLGGTLIAFYTGTSGAQTVTIMRNYSLNGGNLYGYSFPTSALTDIIAQGGAISSTAVNPANQFFIFATIALANAGDSIIPNLVSIHN